jgi:N-sulfoglucosamine sulfohydrolase
MKRLLQLLPALVLGLIPASGRSAERPNILWITSEDNASHWLGCYGNPEALTPRLDALAAKGVRLTRAYSNAPVCAVARSTILTGAHAITMGTHHMRSRYPIPEQFAAHASHLRKAGFHCTNNAKTDYNFKGNDAALWDDCSGKAHYRDRPEGAPFFAIFNLNTTHESQLFPNAKNRKAATRLDPASLTLPPHLPDLPEIRSDFARYHDLMTDMDAEVGKILDQLEADGLAEDTLIFYYGDHGGATPRGKRYLTDTGTRIPMILHIPAKWSHLSPFPAGEPSDELVSFVDLAPTLLSIAGIDPPAAMQGRPFLGPKRVEPAADAMVLLYADRFDEGEGMRRGVTDGRWKYIRNFAPHLAGASISGYPMNQPGWQAWESAWKSGNLTGRFADLWEPGQPVEQLYHLTEDPWEIDNLAADPAHAETLVSLRERLKSEMRKARDIGLIPEMLFAGLAGSQPLHTYIRSEKFNFDATLDLAFLASARDPENLQSLINALPPHAGTETARFWAHRGIQILGQQAASAIPTLRGIGRLGVAGGHALALAAGDDITHAEARAEGLAAIVGELERPAHPRIQQSAIAALKQLGETSQIPEAWIKDIQSRKTPDEYLKRLADEAAAGR